MKSSIADKLTFSSSVLEAGLNSAIEMSRAEMCNIVAKSGLRGRGGAGFHAGVKWNLCAASTAKNKCIVCNAAEGEPGSFKDRVILSGYSNLVFEGMTIAGLAVDARIGIVYLRAEYSYMLSYLVSVLAARRKSNLLGTDILGREGFDFDIQIRLGSGAYVCGEETALIESLEGQRGEPRNRPPFPVDTGFQGSPTVVNNVETLAWVPMILARGPSWFRSYGTRESPGRRLLSVSGDCPKPGVYEFDMGVTIHDVLRKVGADAPKGVQVGGASGVMVSPSQFQRRLAFEDLAQGGAVMVFGHHRNMLDIAHNFMGFFASESCGQCTPCRVGTSKLLAGIEMLQAGKCKTSYLQELISLGNTMRLASKCGLGQRSVNAFLSIVTQYREEILGRNV